MRFPGAQSFYLLGDSIRVEIEKRGDTIIRHYIDLYGQAGDGSDDSYNDVCTYATLFADTSIRSPFYISAGDNRICFDQDSVVRFFDRILNSARLQAIQSRRAAVMTVALL